MVLLRCFVAQMSLCEGALQPVLSQLREDWPFADRCVYILGVFRGPSRVYYKPIRDSARKSSESAVFLRIMQLLRNICDTTMNLR